jgi:superfamily II DNA or RNA helicase
MVSVDDNQYNTKAQLSLGLTPSWHLLLYSDNDRKITSTEVSQQIHDLFSLGPELGLLRLGLTNFTSELPANLNFWRQFAQIFIMQLCKYSQAEEKDDLTKILLPIEEISLWLTQAPFMRGAEYLNLDCAHKLWQELALILAPELKPYNGDIQAYLAAFHSIWNTVGRVCFHLAENKTNLASPFAFLATYITGISAARAQHLPLGRALEEYAGNAKKSQLLALLLPVQRAAAKSTFLQKIVDNGTIFKPLAWGAHEAYQFLQEIPLFEEAGVCVRVPNWWNTKKPPRPNITIAVGNDNTTNIGLNALLDFNLQFALPNGEQITPEEFEALLQNTGQLIHFKGQWIQVDGEKLSQVLTHWKKIERQVKNNGLTFTEGLRLLAGVPKETTDDLTETTITTWSNVIAGEWLQESLKFLRNPVVGTNTQSQLILQQHLQAVLRPYQELGVKWLWWLYNMNLGGCLADDMGLGKTIQVLSLLLLAKYQKPSLSTNTAIHLLVLPASLLGNWQAEGKRFAPDLRIYLAHSSFGKLEAPNLANYDLVITTYSMLSRLTWLSETLWDIIILDEAQAIKNPSSKQTRISKTLKSKVRFALTGTPIENSILDLWSLFDFVTPGLLGTNRDFATYHKKNSPQLYAALRKLVNPYILRRLKSDKSIINDLPDKTEIQTYCTLTKEQIGLYQQAVTDLKLKLEAAAQNEQQASNIQRQGLVLSYILRFKQICNHPAQCLGHGNYDLERSGKLLRLQEICETIVEKQEKLLVFTQFREIIPALHEFLAKIFSRQGLILHGQTPAKERTKMATAFQAEDGPPYFILSLKAGGTGLNLTAASHVIHFDRWWNPAVENQATDRAYRIGQKKNVLVHKFICQGTIEEKIDSLINDKKSLSNEILANDREFVLTELSDSELIKVVSLDLHRALGVE